METGLRQVEIWEKTMWVTVRPTEDENQYLIEPSEGKEFKVTATTDGEVVFEITKELRRQFPHR